MLQRKPCSRFRRWSVRILFTLCCLTLAEWGVSQLIARQLISELEERIDGRLVLGRVWYIPPFGLWCSEASLWREDQPLVSLGLTRIRLAQVPLPNRPLMIQSLAIERPVLELTRTDQGLFGGPGFIKPRPTTRNRPPRKLSEILQLRHFRLDAGTFTYVDRRHADPLPVRWSGINMDMDLERKTASAYGFAFSAGGASKSAINGKGSIDIDSLQLDLWQITGQLAIDHHQPAGTLPAGVQRLLSGYEITGRLALDAEVHLQLPKLDTGRLRATLDLRDITAWIAAANLTITDARARLDIEQSPDAQPPFSARLRELEIASGPSRFVLDRGEVNLDFSSLQWSLAGTSGHLDLRPATTRPVPQAQDLLLRLAPAGRIDFTATGGGPLQWLGRELRPRIADYQLFAYPRDVSCSLPKFDKRLEHLTGGFARVQYGLISFSNLSADYGHDTFRLIAARLPLADLSKSLRLEEISSVAVIRQPTEPYPPKLYKILDTLGPDGVFFIGGSFTLDRTLPRPEARWNLIVSSDTARLNLAKWRIPIEQIRGDISVANDRISASHVEARLFGGPLIAAGWLEPGEVNRYAGQVELADASLRSLDEHLRPLYSGRRYAGDVRLNATFSGADPPQSTPLAGLLANGEVQVLRGDFFHLPIISGLLNAAGLGKAATTVGEGAAAFSLKEGVFTLRQAAITSPLVGFQGGGTIGLNGDLALEVIVAPLADWRNKVRETNIPLISNVFGEIAGGVQKLLNAATSNLLYQFRIGGNVRDFSIRPIPVPAITDAAAFVIGRMVQGVSGGELLRTVKQAQPEGTTRQ